MASGSFIKIGRRGWRILKPDRTGVLVFKDPDESQLNLFRFFIAGLMVAVFALNLYLVMPRIGPFPIRSLFSISALLILVSIIPKTVAKAVRINATILVVVGMVALLGLLLSILEGQLAGALFALAEVHIQAVVILLITTGGALVLGPRRLAWLFILMVGVSCAFGVAQWLGFRPAWTVRDYLGFVYENPLDPSLSADRPPGLAFSTISLAGQSCIMFALALLFQRAWRSTENVTRNQREAWFSLPWLMMCAAGLTLVNIAGGNRSPLLGLVIFLILLMIGTSPKRWFLAVPTILFGTMLIAPLQELASDFGLRVGSTDDKSVSARESLMDYGWQLFTLNPFGYGLTFDSTEFYRLGAIDFGAISMVPGLGDAFGRVGLHNYPLTMLNRYGVFGIFVAVWATILLKRYWKYALLFVPYFVHTFFHNLGPLDSDYIIWCAVALCVVHQYLEPDRKEARAKFEQDTKLLI